MIVIPSGNDTPRPAIPDDTIMRGADGLFMVVVGGKPRTLSGGHIGTIFMDMPDSFIDGDSYFVRPHSEPDKFMRKCASAKLLRDCGQNGLSNYYREFSISSDKEAVLFRLFHT